jgi:hypothetical protein
MLWSMKKQNCGRAANGTMGLVIPILPSPCLHVSKSMHATTLLFIFLFAKKSSYQAAGVVIFQWNIKSQLNFLT